MLRSRKSTDRGILAECKKFEFGEMILPVLKKFGQVTLLIAGVNHHNQHRIEKTLKK